MENTLIHSFVAIDFETIGTPVTINNEVFNYLPCSVGIVRIVNGKEVMRFHSYLQIDSTGTWKNSVSGIDSDLCMEALPVFEVAQLIPYFAGDLPLVAHGATTEINVLADIRRLYPELNEMGILNYGKDSFIDTLYILKHFDETDNSLSAACLRHGVQSENPHDALADAEAVAQLFLKLQDLGPIEKATPPARYTKHPDVNANDIARFKENKENERKDLLGYFLPDEEVVRKDTCFYRKSVCCTGLAAEEKNKLWETLLSLGAKNMKGMSGKIDILVAGPSAGPSKLASAESMGKTIMQLEEVESYLSSLNL